MQMQLVSAQPVWDDTLRQMPGAHVLQSWAWGEVKARHGWSPTRVLFCEHGETVAAAQILRRALPRTPFGVLYAPKGPALRTGDAELFRRVLEELEEFARTQRGVFIKIDPDLCKGQPAVAELAGRGWRVSEEQIQFYNTVTLDLARSEQEILAAMKPKWRYNIRLAERKGVKVEEGKDGAADLRLFYELYAETAARDGFLIRSPAYYGDVWATMLRAGHARLLLARTGAEVIAGLILFRFGDRAWYFYGASRSAQRDLMPNHLLQWEAMRWAKSVGCTEYDFWGAPNALEDTAPMYGVYKFKMGFGGEFVERIPAHDFVVNAPLYWAYAVARPRYLARLRRARPTEAQD